MPKLLKLAFTGNAVLTPEYPDDLAPIPGPLDAIMPHGRRVRASTFPGTQINAQFAFLAFPLRHLFVREGDRSSRGADHRHPALRPTTGLCILEREFLRLDHLPFEHGLSFDDSPMTCYPTKETTATKWIAKWSGFVPGGFAAVCPDTLLLGFDAVTVEIPAGVISAGFVAEPIARINFDYGLNPETRPFAQEIVVTLTYPDEFEEVTFTAFPTFGPNEPSVLTFRWYDKNEMKLTFGNGSLASILSLLEGSIAGHDHQGDFDAEFEITYDVVDCFPDQNDRLPLPRVLSHEVLRIPCIASMVPPPPTLDFFTAATLAEPTARAARDSRGRRTGGNTR